MSKPSSAPRGKSRWMPTIWIVDDDDGIRSALEVALEGHPVRSFRSPGATKSALEDQLPHIMILDIIFGADQSAGLEFLEWLGRQHSAILVIMLSGSRYMRDRFIAGQLRAFDFVEKARPEGSVVEDILQSVDRARSACTSNHLLSSILGETDLIASTTARDSSLLPESVQRALRWYVEHIEETGPSVQAVARGIGISNGTLNAWLRTAFKSNAYLVLSQVALMIAGHLIVSGVSCIDAAGMVGMSYERLRRRFHAEFSCPPGAAASLGLFNSDLDIPSRLTQLRRSKDT